MKVINIAQNFSEVPVGRFYSDGPDSGERFRDEFLEPILAQGESVIVQLDGTEGYGSSFLDEAFGGIVRKLNLSLADAKARIKLESSNKTFIQEIESYIEDAARREARN